MNPRVIDTPGVTRSGTVSSVSAGHPGGVARYLSNPHQLLIRVSLGLALAFGFSVGLYLIVGFAFGLPSPRAHLR